MLQRVAMCSIGVLSHTLRAGGGHWDSNRMCVAVCFSMLQCVNGCSSHELRAGGRHRDSNKVHVAVCCSVLQCVAVCCSVLQCVCAIEGTPRF